MIFHEDDRAQRLINIFPELNENWQINLSYVNKTNHVVAWHKHSHQTDYWVCIKGSFKVGLKDHQIERKSQNNSAPVKFEYLSDKNMKVLKIPPETWHGYMALEPGSILLYGVDHKYDPNDEHRAKPGDFEETWTTENK